LKIYLRAKIFAYVLINPSHRTKKHYVNTLTP